MPFADTMPTVVFPKTHKGHLDWEKWDKSEITKPYFCSDYEQDGYRRTCARRDSTGMRSHNLCFRCVAGFLYDFQRAVEQTDDENRLKV